MSLPRAFRVPSLGELGRYIIVIPIFDLQTGVVTVYAKSYDSAHLSKSTTTPRKVWTFYGAIPSNIDGSVPDGTIALPNPVDIYEWVKGMPEFAGAVDILTE